MKIEYKVDDKRVSKKKFESKQKDKKFHVFEIKTKKDHFFWSSKSFYEIVNI